MTSYDDDDDMPPDPDRDHVPAELLAMEGQAVTLTHPDGTVDRGMLVVPVGAFGDAHRLRAGDA